MSTYAYAYFTLVVSTFFYVIDWNVKIAYLYEQIKLDFLGLKKWNNQLHKGKVYIFMSDILIVTCKFYISFNDYENVVMMN